MSDQKQSDIDSLMDRLNSLSVEEPSNPGQPDSNPMQTIDPDWEAEYFRILGQLAKIIGIDGVLDCKKCFSHRPKMVEIIDRVLADLLKDNINGSDGEVGERIGGEAQAVVQQSVQAEGERALEREGGSNEVEGKEAAGKDDQGEMMVDDRGADERDVDMEF